MLYALTKFVRFGGGYPASQNTYRIVLLVSK
jgi:hypothetical protein